MGRRIFSCLKGKKCFQKKNAFLYPLENPPKRVSSPLPFSRSTGSLRQSIPSPKRGLRNFWEDVSTAALKISHSGLHLRNISSNENDRKRGKAFFKMKAGMNSDGSE
jgi:hypothetical protein